MVDPSELACLEGEVAEYRRLRSRASSFWDLRILWLLPGPLGAIIIIAIALAWEPTQSDGPTALEGPLGQFASLLITIGFFGGGVFMLATSGRQRRAEATAESQAEHADHLARTINLGDGHDPLQRGETMGQWTVSTATETELELVRLPPAPSRTALRASLGFVCVAWAGLINYGLHARGTPTTGLSLTELAYHYVKLVAITGLNVGIPMTIFVLCVRPRIERVLVSTGLEHVEILLERAFFGLHRHRWTLQMNPDEILVAGAHKGEVHRLLPNRYETILDQSSSQGRMTSLDAWRYTRLGLELQARAGVPAIIVDHAPVTEIFRPHFEHGAFIPFRDVPDLPGLGIFPATDEYLRMLAELETRETD